MSRLRSAVADLSPGYFSLVMATGIVSIAAHLLAMPAVAWILLAVNVAAYAVLVVMSLARLVGHFGRVLEDVADHGRGPGFFTWVAGTSVLGTELLLVAGMESAPLALWIAGIVLWVVIMYAFFFAVTVREEKPTLESGINGAWLIATVATQSIAILGTLLAPRFEEGREVALFFALAMFLLGCMLYISIITLIFYRFTFLRLRIETLTPPYWINMGAVAITTLAGSTLMLNAFRWSFLEEIRPFLAGFTLFFWASGTWWIPLLFLLGAWRHLYRGHPFRYDPQYWGMVFPLGMYTTCTFQLARAIGAEFLLVIPRYFVFVALAAWVAAFAGLVHALASELLAVGRSRRASRAAASR